MRRPGLKSLNRSLRHSKIGDRYYDIEAMEIPGHSDYYFAERIEKLCPSTSAIPYNKLNKRDGRLNKKDANSYGHWF